MLDRLADPRPLPLRTKLALVIEVLAVYARARLYLRWRGIQATLARLRGPAVASAGSPIAYAAGARLGQVVSRVLGALRSPSRCLMMSVVLSAMLARRGVENVIVVGVNSGTTFGAHAWVELDGAALLPSGGGAFERLVTL